MPLRGSEWGGASVTSSPHDDPHPMDNIISKHELERLDREIVELRRRIKQWETREEETVREIAYQQENLAGVESMIEQERIWKAQLDDANLPDATNDDLEELREVIQNLRNSIQGGPGPSNSDVQQFTALQEECDDIRRDIASEENKIE